MFRVYKIAIFIYVAIFSYEVQAECYFAPPPSIEPFPNETAENYDQRVRPLLDQYYNTLMNGGSSYAVCRSREVADYNLDIDVESTATARRIDDAVSMLYRKAGAYSSKLRDREWETASRRRAGDLVGREERSPTTPAAKHRAALTCVELSKESAPGVGASGPTSWVIYNQCPFEVRVSYCTVFSGTGGNFCADEQRFYRFAVIKASGRFDTNQYATHYEYGYSAIVADFCKQELFLKGECKPNSHAVWRDLGAPQTVEETEARYRGGL